MKLLHTDLKQNDIVIFKRICDIDNKEEFQDGSVIIVNENRKTVSISWLYGYKSMVDDVPFDKVIAKYDPNGEWMRFGVYSGNSVLLRM